MSQKRERVKDIEHLLHLSWAQRSVQWHGSGERPIPAAVVLSMTAIVVHERIKRGLYVYERPKKRSRWTKKDDATKTPTKERN